MMTFKPILKIAALTFFLGLSLQQADAQRHWNRIDREKIVSSDTTKKGKYTLVFINMQPGFSDDVKKRLTDVFFEVYPKEARTYNKKTLRKVIFIVDPGYDGVAATSGEIVRFNPDWFRQHPEDVDVVTHEVMHIVQSYPGGAGPGWITEGIADYVRFDMGVDNEGAHWKLPEYSSKQSYTDAYRVAARFFHWIEKNQKKGFVKKLDDAMRTKTYDDSFWQKNTGKTLDELWGAYAANPVIS